MASCQDIITRALRKLNALPIGAALNAGEAGNALIVLQSMYMELVGWGAFGRENDILATGNWQVMPGQRVRALNTNAQITIPDQVPPKWFPWWWNPSWNWFDWPVWPVSQQVCGCCVAPDDLSVVTVVDPTAGTAQTFLYDAYIGSWARLDGLQLQTEAPLSRRWTEPLANVLAGRLAPDYGAEITPALAASIGNGSQAIAQRWGSPQRPVVGEYM